MIRRKRYRPTCQCPGHAGIITAPAAAKLIPKGRYGISVWTQVLLDKFLFFRPSHRLIADLATHGIELPAGTLAGGLQRIAPMLQPLYQAIGQHCRAATHWHADETGWKVFVKVEEKADHKRTLWAEGPVAQAPVAEVPPSEVPPVAKPPPSPFAKGTRRRRSPEFPLTYSGRQFTEEELQQVRALIAASPDATRTALSRQVCQWLDWRKADGGWKEVSCRVALLRMHEDGWLTLPPPRSKNNNARRTPARTLAAEPQPLQEFSLPQLGRLRWEIVTGEQSALWNEYIDRYHYLSYTPLVGAQLRYFAYAEDRLLALFGYGASAWRLAPRDRWIGWSDAQRQARLPHVVAQVRFLILPWIRCPHLASKLLSLSAKRLGADWERRYGIRPWLLESFVDTDRFQGTCYRAANWINVGSTQGRGKKDRHRRARLPKKQVYLYPLCRNCRERLAEENPEPRD